MAIRGGFGEPYCSQECHDKGGKYIAAVMLKNQTGVCGVCQRPVQASMYGGGELRGGAVRGCQSVHLREMYCPRQGSSPELSQMLHVPEAIMMPSGHA